MAKALPGTQDLVKANLALLHEVELRLEEHHLPGGKSLNEHEVGRLQVQLLAAILLTMTREL